MKPKPFALLNHLTVPFNLTFSFLRAKPYSAPVQGAGLKIASIRLKPRSQSLVKDGFPTYIGKVLFGACLNFLSQLCRRFVVLSIEYIAAGAFLPGFRHYFRQCATANYLIRCVMLVLQGARFSFNCDATIQPATALQRLPSRREFCQRKSCPRLSTAA